MFGPRPLYIGFLQPFAVVLAMAALFGYALRDLPPPSAELMRSVAGIGITIVLAYVIEAVWMVGRLERVGADREAWLGSAVGMTVCGLSGVAAAVLVAAHREAMHSNYLDTFGLWWVVASLGLLGAMVALQPLIADRWTKEDETSATEPNGSPGPEREA